MKKSTLLLLAALLILVMIGPASAQGENLLQDPSFEGENYILISIDNADASRYHVPAGWSGGVIRTPGAESWVNAHPTGFPHTAGIKRSGGRSFHMARGGATFTAYLYQQVPVVPGTSIQGGAWAYLENRGGGRVRAGIDPTGGADPFSPNVVWSGWTNSRNSWTQLDVSTTTRGSTATLFLYATQDAPSNPNGVYWDDAYLNGTRGQTPVVSAAAATTGGTALVTADTNVRVRRGPGIDQARLGAMAAGESYPLVEDLGAWYAIDFNGETGYVSSQFSTLGGGSAIADAPSSGGNTSAPIATGAALDYFVDYTLKMRSAPGTDSSEILSIPHTAVVQAVARSSDNNWLLVNYEGQSGWVAAWIGRLQGSISSLPVR